MSRRFEKDFVVSIGRKHVIKNLKKYIIIHKSINSKIIGSNKNYISDGRRGTKSLF